MKIYLTFQVFDLRFIKGLKKMDDLEKVDIDRTKACVSCDRIYIKKFSCDRFFPMKSDKLKKKYEDYKKTILRHFCKHNRKDYAENLDLYAHKNLN